MNRTVQFKFRYAARRICSVEQANDRPTFFAVLSFLIWV